MRKLFLNLAIAMAALWITAAPAAAQDNATSVTFTALHIDCSSSVGTASFTFAINGTAIGTVPFTQGCACNSAPLSATFSDAATLALLNAPACNVFTVTVNDPQGGAYVGYVRAEISRTVSGTESTCVQDYAGFVSGGGTCVNRDICTGYQFSPGSFNNGLPDADGDGSANCADTDDDNDTIVDSADNCPNTANTDQADSNGDGIGNVCEPKAITVPWMGVPTSPHQVYSGGQLVLQGTVRMDPAFTITAASWDPGDGSGAVALSAPFNPRALERVHTYAGVDGTPYNATLSVTVSNGTVSKTITDTFRVVVRTKTQEVEVDMAIDKGLWYLHKELSLGTLSGQPSGRWTTDNDMAATSSAVQAFEINNHRENGNRDEDPYVDDVARGLVHLFGNIKPLAIGLQTAGDPDSNGNGIGLTMTNDTSTPEGYVIGQVLDAIVASGTPAALASVGDATWVKNRSYKDIVQDLMDSYSWGQADPSHGAARGGWWYDLNTGSDTSAAQWGAIAGLAAASWGVPVPAFVKSENLLWVDQASFFDGSNAGVDGRFDYDGGNGSGSVFSQSAAESPSGLVMMVFGGVPSTSAQYKATERYMSRLFYSSNVWDSENHIYGMYAMAKGFRLASPPVTTLDAMGNATPLANFNWYSSEPVGGAPKGVARILLEAQQASGRFDAAQWASNHLTTAWSVIILSPTIFQLGPTAVCKAEPSTTGVGGVVSFSSTGSVHNDPGGVIAGFSWDFQDGGSASGAAASHAFAATGTYNVVLTVTDANGLTDTASCPVDVVAGAIPPNSNPGAAYSFCQGSPTLMLDGSASSDPDGSIVSYDWDWTAPLNFTPADATGVNVNAAPAFSGFAPGTYDVALRVTDNNGITNTDFTTVTVKPAGDPSCNQPPTFTAPDNISTPATSAAGADVTFTANGNDAEQGAIPAVCAPPSGSTFPIGTTTVNCTVTDNGGLTASGSFTVTVTNNAPTFTPPADITTVATGPGGAAVTFIANGNDVENGVIPAVCLPASGSNFPVGTTTVNCTVTDGNGASTTGSFTVTVTPANSAPVCSATPSVSAIWPANNRLVPISLNGISDPEGNTFTVTVTSIAQDEPTNAAGSGNTPSDATGIGTSVAQVRAERAGGADGRFYHISFTATDSAGASCTGTVKVVVPHDQGKNSVPVDGGKKFNSVTGAPLP